jgi:ribonuclease D
LAELAEKLAAQPIVAVDTESNSLYAYRERVCLIQFSIPGGDYLVDPLAIEDLSALASLFASPAVEKVFHAAEYDLLTLKRDFGYTFANLFDTMIAARILGREKVGLGSLIEDEFGIALKKKFQRANWGKRPLPKDMLDYARLDTFYLIDLRGKLLQQLKKYDRWPIAEEDFTRLCVVDGNGPEPQETNIWRINGVRDLTPEQATVLKHLAEYRQGRAEQLDLPLFKVLSDKTLVAIAATQPQTRNELETIPGMSPKQMRFHAKGLLAALQAGRKDKPTFRPKRPRMSDELVARLDALKTWRKTRAMQMGVESDVIMPRVLVEEIAFKNPATREGLAQALASSPWRLANFGEEIQAVLNGK